MIVSPSCAYNLKTVGARRGAAPCPSPFASVTEWMRHSIPLELSAADCNVCIHASVPLNRCKAPQTKLNQDTTVGCEVVTTLKRCIVQVGLGYEQIHEPN